MSALMAAHAAALTDGGRRKIRKALRQVDGAVQLAEARHLADDRLGELRGLLGTGEF